LSVIETCFSGYVFKEVKVLIKRIEQVEKEIYEVK
jgi:hypothetical protein